MDENKEPERLSFFEEKEEKKKVDTGPIYVLMIILFVSGIMLVYAVNQKKEGAELKGLQTNSNKLKSTKDPKNGLQENHRTEGAGGEQGDNPKKLTVGASPFGVTAKGGQATGTFETPGILPDSEGEDLNISASDTVDDINRMAWKAYYAENVDLAIRLFKISIERDANNFHSVSGLGKAYEKKGQKDLAIQQYCKVGKLPAVDTKDVEFWLAHAEQLGSSCE